MLRGSQIIRLKPLFPTPIVWVMSFQYYYFQITIINNINNNNKKLFSDSSLCWLVETERGKKAPYDWLTVNDNPSWGQGQPCCLELGLRVRNTVLRDLLKLLNRVASGLGQIVFLLLKRMMNAIPPRHKWTVEKCVYVCVCVSVWTLHCLILLSSKFLCFRILCNSWGSVTFCQCVWKDDFRSDRSVKERSAARLLFP